MVDLKYPG